MYRLGNGLAELQAHTTQRLVLLTQYGALVVELVIPLDQVYRVLDELGRICPNYVKGELLIGGLCIFEFLFLDIHFLLLG